MFLIACDKSKNKKFPQAQDIILPSGQDTPGTGQGGPQIPSLKTGLYAVLSTTNENYSTNALSVLDIDSQRLVNGLNPNSNDVSFQCHGSDIYEIGRYNSNYITKYSVDNPEQAKYQFSLVGADTGENPNPMKIVPVSKQKAYIIFLDTDVIWVVNPSAERQEDFYIKSISLKQYANDKMRPNANGPAQLGANLALAHDGKLYVSLARFNRVDEKDGCRSLAQFDSYIVVIDTNTDEEVETGQGKNGLKGIALKIRNPQKMRVLQDRLVVAASAELCPNINNKMGGLEAIAIEDYSNRQVILPRLSLLDFAASMQGRVYVLENIDIMNSETKNWVLEPSTASIGPSRVQDNNQDFFEIKALETAPNGEIWMLDANVSFPGIYRINPVEDSVVGLPFDTNLRPMGIQFCQKDGYEMPDLETMEKIQDNLAR